VLRGSFIALISLASLTLPLAAAVDFSKQVLPVLQRACFECHGPEVQKADLRLDSKALAFTTGEHAPVITPGKPDTSEHLRRISLPRSDKQAMPRRGAPLSAAEIDSLRTWIAEGAVWPDEVTTATHWAYVKPVKPSPPAVKNMA
jgi:hypothetical protein